MSLQGVKLNKSWYLWLMRLLQWDQLPVAWGRTFVIIAPKFSATYLNRENVNMIFKRLQKFKYNGRRLWDSPLDKVSNYHHSSVACMHGDHNLVTFDIFFHSLNLDDKESSINIDLITQQ